MSCVTLFLAAVLLGDPAHVKPQRSPHQLRQAVHATLRSTAPAANSHPDQAVPELVALFEEVRAHERMTAQDRQRYQGLLRARLEHIAARLEKQVPAVAPATVQLPVDKAGQGGVLAQLANNRPAGAARMGANGNVRGNDVTSDNARQLVELIETTIAPTTWERAGGLGTIRYYQPFRVMVIRQTGDVHDQLGGLLGGPGR